MDGNKPHTHPGPSRQSVIHQYNRFRIFASTLLFCCLSYACFASLSSRKSEPVAWIGTEDEPTNTETDNAFGLNPDDRPWSGISPQPELVYHRCYDGLQCARLLMPMDWKQGGNGGATVAIAVLKVPAKVEVSDPRYGGAIIVNPGGPGDSGTEYVRANGRNLQDAFDPILAPNSTEHSPKQEEHKYFDIIGFDPRTVMHSTPRIECFQSSFTRFVWQLQSFAEILGGPGTSVEARWSRYKSLSRSCMRRISKEGERNIAYHVSTTPTARDLVELNERHGQWRESHARKWISSPAGVKATHDRLRSHPLHKQAVLERTKWQAGKELLQYYGESYGTTLGQYVATMYPEKMHRTVFDSTHLVNTSELNGFPPQNLVDSDRVLASFCGYCHLAGPTKCPLYRDSAKDVCAVVEEVFAQLYKGPLVVPSTDQRGPAVVTYADLKRSFGRAVYAPVKAFPRYARIFQDLSQGNGSSFANWKSASEETQFADAVELAPSQKCLDEGPFSGACQNVGQRQDEVELSIFCTDHEGAEDLDMAEFEHYWARMKEQSKVLGDIFAEHLLKCVGWSVRAKWRETGPFSSHPKSPILFINNRFDPVCPLREANTVASKFERSVVLVQNTVGHVSRSSKSKCSSAIVRNYFQTGELPVKGTTCEVDDLPFGASEVWNPVAEVF